MSSDTRSFLFKLASVGSDGAHSPHLGKEGPWTMATSRFLVSPRLWIIGFEVSCCFTIPPLGITTGHLCDNLVVPPSVVCSVCVVLRGFALANRLWEEVSRFDMPVSSQPP